MTLIVTQFSHHGIVLAADSNVSLGGTLLGVRRKVFRIPTIPAGIACAGSMFVGNKAVEDWMDEFIQAEQASYSDLRGFCDLLVASLNRDRTEQQKKKPVIAHVAGYVAGVPMMWHISNVELLLDQGGRYSNPVPDITVEGPDFDQGKWDGLVLSNPEEAMPLAYFVNGPVEGRVAFNTYVQSLNDWLRHLWQPALPFRAPTSIQEQEDVTRTSMEVMRLLFRMSSMSATIGGTIQSIAISPSGVGEVSLVTEAAPDHVADGTGLASLESDEEI
jgi:hypothetical protein